MSSMDDGTAKALGGYRSASDDYSSPAPEIDQFFSTPEFYQELRRIMPLLKEMDPNGDVNDSIFYEQLREHFELAPEEWDMLLKKYPALEKELLVERQRRVQRGLDELLKSPPKGDGTPKFKPPG